VIGTLCVWTDGAVLLCNKKLLFSFHVTQGVCIAADQSVLSTHTALIWHAPSEQRDTHSRRSRPLRMTPKGAGSRLDTIWNRTPKDAPVGAAPSFSAFGHYRSMRRSRLFETGASGCRVRKWPLPRSSAGKSTHVYILNDLLFFGLCTNYFERYWALVSPLHVFLLCMLS
jgi:hypothetical protein